jgi:hypothetical protein
MKKGYEETYKWVVNLLQQCNFADSSKRHNIKQTSQDEVSVEFLGRIYLVSKNGIKLAEQKIIWPDRTEEFDYNLKSVLGYYVLSEAGIEPFGDFCTLSSFSNGVFRENYESGVLNSCPLGKVYGADYQKFCNDAKRIGMVFEKNKSSGQYIWQYMLLPKIPIKLIYYEGDDEFPTKIQILYDKTAIQYFKFEPLAVLNACFIKGFSAIGEMQYE